MLDTARSYLPDLAIGDDFLESSDTLNARSRARIVLANDAKRERSCSMNLIEDVGMYAA